MSASGGAVRLVLGDQLSEGLSALRDLDPTRDVVLMAEVRAEATYVRHHKKKIALIFAAMRRFAEALRACGVRVRYVGYEDPLNSGSITGEIERALAEEGLNRAVVTEPGEWRLLEAFRAFQAGTEASVAILEDDRFLCSRAEFERWAAGKKQLRMEFFYREMRRKTGLLMDASGAPEGGQWNFDKENRKRLPRNVSGPWRAWIAPHPVAKQAMADVARLFPDHFGDLEPFGFPTSRDEALALLEHFATDCLPGFGDWQDAMSAGDPFLWHALLSTSMNLGLLGPLEVCERVVAEYAAGRAPLNAVEGFVRQIIGWREYVRGIYWLNAPEYGTLNALEADRALPWFYWSGETKMACVRDVVEVTRRHAYAHHIQRLMVTGQLAMLLGVHPDLVDEWYLVVYADAYEWVEQPNTRGMATFADGGIMASKPYAASGAYIDRMSDYCGRCAYDVKQKTGPNACPFNVLYWDFLARHEKRLRANPRLGIAYKSLDAMPADRRATITREAEGLRIAFGAVPLDRG